MKANRPKKRYLFVEHVDMAIDGNKEKAEALIREGLNGERELLSRLRNPALQPKERDQVEWDLKEVRKLIRSGQRILDSTIPKLAAKRAEIATEAMLFMADGSIPR